MSLPKYGVWGNPIAQSLSPEIHQGFAKQFGFSIDYQRLLGDEELFEQQLKDFFLNGGVGCNITAPFKARAFALADQHSERCLLAEACNTLKKLPNGQLYADNTDGLGLVADLKRLGWLKPQQKILILGAGGATKGVLLPLLQAEQVITIANRTLATAEKLASRFSNYGKLRATTLSEIEIQAFDVIINATSSGLQGEVVAINPQLFHLCHAVYDMQYSKIGETPFIQYAKQHNIQHHADGLGMLKGQAAYAFELWFGQMPEFFSF